MNSKAVICSNYDRYDDDGAELNDTTLMIFQHCFNYSVVSILLEHYTSHDKVEREPMATLTKIGIGHGDVRTAN